MIEAMKQALEALEMCESPWPNTKDNQVTEAITSLRQAIAEAEKQEPVAWPCLIADADFEKDTVTLVMQCTDYKVSAGKHWLHTSQPQRQPLSDEQLHDLWFKQSIDWMEFARAIEAAHGIKGEA